MIERTGRPSDEKFEVEGLRLKAQTQLDLLFLDIQGSSGEPLKPTVTQGPNGERRLRALVYDPDGYAEYLESVGVVPVEDGYIVESYRMADGGRKFWHFNTARGQLDCWTIGADNKTILGSPHDLPSDPLRDLEDRWSDFSRCIDGVSSSCAYDYNEWSSPQQSAHAFALPQLQGAPR